MGMDKESRGRGHGKSGSKLPDMRIDEENSHGYEGRSVIVVRLQGACDSANPRWPRRTPCHHLGSARVRARNYRV